MGKDNSTPSASTSFPPGRCHHSPLRSQSSVTATAGEDGCGSSFSSATAPALQFFVRMLSGSRTLVIHADPSDSVKTVLDKIQSIVGIPVQEQRLIYRGKQLHWEQSLTDCDLQNDAGLQLVSRLRSTTHPEACYCVDDMVSKIFDLYKGRPAWPATQTVKSRLVEFLTDIPRNNEESSREYLEIFRSSSAPAALVMLYLSPFKSCRDCANACIKHFIEHCKTFSKRPVYGQLACIVLEFCKLLSRGAGIEDHLYIICRSCLGSMVQYIGILVTETEMSKGIISVTDIFPFLGELAAKLFQDLGLSMDPEMVARPMLSDVRDFVAFSYPIRNSLCIHDWDALPLPNRHDGGNGGSGEQNMLY